MPDKPIRILIVEDQFFFRVALHSIVEGNTNMQVVAETATGANAVSLYREHRPTVVIVDLRLPDVNGIDVIHALRREDAQARILVLSNYEGSEDIHRALRAGALSYLTKDADANELAAALMVVAQGKCYLPKLVGAALASRMPDDSLTEREGEVMELLAHGCSNRDIAERLKISENTARIHVGRILEKFGVADRTQAVLVAIQRGIVHL